jgi:hypothetical protein
VSVVTLVAASDAQDEGLEDVGQATASAVMYEASEGREGKWRGACVFSI